MYFSSPEGGIGLRCIFYHFSDLILLIVQFFSVCSKLLDTRQDSLPQIQLVLSFSYGLSAGKKMAILSQDTPSLVPDQRLNKEAGQHPYVLSSSNFSLLWVSHLANTTASFPLLTTHSKGIPTATTFCS